MTISEKSTLTAMLQEVVTAEAELSAAQSGMHAALHRRNHAQETLTQFVDSIQTSDTQVEPKRGRPKGSRTRKPVNGLDALGTRSAIIGYTTTRTIEQDRTAPNEATNNGH